MMYTNALITHIESIDGIIESPFLPIQKRATSDEGAIYWRCECIGRPRFCETRLHAGLSR